MQMGGSLVTIGWSVVGPEDDIGAGSPWSVEKTDDVADGRGVHGSYCVLRGACWKMGAFGRVLRVADGKGAKSVQKGTENSKLLARISGYLRVIALICGFEKKLGQVLPDWHEQTELRVGVGYAPIMAR